MIDDTNCTPNYRWNLAHNIRQTISQMDDVRKHQLLDTIRLQCICHELLEQNYNLEVCNYIKSLLNSKRPVHSIARRRT